MVVGASALDTASASQASSSGKEASTAADKSAKAAPKYPHQMVRTDASMGSLKSYLYTGASQAKTPTGSSSQGPATAMTSGPSSDGRGKRMVDEAMADEAADALPSSDSAAGMPHAFLLRGHG